MDSLSPLYPLRKKLDGSPNALCLNCLATIVLEHNNGQNNGRKNGPKRQNIAQNAQNAAYLKHVCKAWLPSERDPRPS